MKRINKIIILLLASSCVLSGCSGGLKYETGKDTVLAVGNGRFQILSGSEIDFKNRIRYDDYDLVDQENEEDAFIFLKCVGYYDDETNKKLYVRNKDNEYIVVDYARNTYKKYKNGQIPKSVLEEFKTIKINMFPVESETISDEEFGSFFVWPSE